MPLISQSMSTLSVAQRDREQPDIRAVRERDTLHTTGRLERETVAVDEEGTRVFLSVIAVPIRHGDRAIFTGEILRIVPVTDVLHELFRGAVRVSNYEFLSFLTSLDRRSEQPQRPETARWQSDHLPLAYDCVRRRRTAYIELHVILRLGRAEQIRGVTGSTLIETAIDSKLFPIFIDTPQIVGFA